MHLLSTTAYDSVEHHKPNIPSSSRSGPLFQGLLRLTTSRKKARNFVWRQRLDLQCKVYSCCNLLAPHLLVLGISSDLYSAQLKARKRVGLPASLIMHWQFTPSQIPGCTMHTLQHGGKVYFKFFITDINNNCARGCLQTWASYYIILLSLVS